MESEYSSQQQLKINNLYFLGDNFYENGAFTNSLTVVLKEIAKYRPIIPSIPKAKTISLPNCYHNNSFSNGPVISENLAKKFTVLITPAWELNWIWKVIGISTKISTTNNGNNYAFAGATSYYDSSEYEARQELFLKNVFPRATRNWSFIKEAIPLLVSKFSLIFQTDALLKQHQTFKDSDVVLISSGVNDIKNLIDKVEKQANYDIEKYLENSINNLKISFEKLIKNNAKKIVINNVFDLSKAPLYSTKNEKVLNDIVKFINIYNNKLKQLIDTFEVSHPNTVKLFDFYTEFNEIVNLLSQKQIDAKQQAIKSMQHEQLLIDIFSSDIQMQADNSEVNKFLFLDDIHPTKVVHEMVADKIYGLLLGL